MATEIEYKFLLNPEFQDLFFHRISTLPIKGLHQGYITTNEHNIIEVKINDGKACIHIKVSHHSTPFIYPLSLNDALEIIAMACDKTAPHYFHNSNENIFRIRITNENNQKNAFITIKGKADGPSKPEYEWSIPLNDAEILLSSCATSLGKNRFVLEENGFVWEGDVFTGLNEGLILVELELIDKDIHYKKPLWIGEDVTDDHRYSNSYLSSHPFSQWSLN